MGVWKLKPKDEKIMGKFETLCAFHTPVENIAQNLGVSIDTLHNWVFLTYGNSFSCVYQRFMQEGNNILNKNCLAQTTKNALMAIWLRKQWLGERDPDSQKEAGVQEIEDWTPISEMLKDDDSNK